LGGTEGGPASPPELGGTEGGPASPPELGGTEGGPASPPELGGTEGGPTSPPELGGTEGGNIPNPISVNFGDRMELVGYDLDRRAVHPGEAVTLALYWRGLRRMDVNYTISAQLVDAGQRKAAQHDSWPLDGAAPTAAWEPGQVLADKYILAVAQDTPAGVYNVRLAVYVFEEGTITHLPTIPEGGRMQANYIVLTTVRVAP